MYLTLGRAEPIKPATTSETPGPVSPMALTKVLDTTTSEFHSICRVVAQTAGGKAVGSGVLVTPRHVLTCGHVLTPPENPTTVRAVTVFVAQNGRTDERNGIKADAWAVKHGFGVNCCRSFDEDYGIIRLSKAAAGYWPMQPFDPRQIVGKAAYLAGYPALTKGDPAEFMYRSRGRIVGSIQIDSCIGLALRRTLWPTIDDTTRLVAHRLDTAKAMSGGPMWSFIDGKRTLWGLHAGDIDGGYKKAVLFNKNVIGQIARWISREFPAR